MDMYRFKQVGNYLIGVFFLFFSICSFSVFAQKNLAKVRLVVGNNTKTPLYGIGAELDPHFFAQNVWTRNDGVKAEDWNRIVVKRVKEMEFQTARVMAFPSWYEPTNDNDNPNVIDWTHFKFDSPEMQSLYAVLDLCQSQHIRVTLALWGAPLNHFLAGNQTGFWIDRKSTRLNSSHQ